MCDKKQHYEELIDKFVRSNEETLNFPPSLQNEDRKMIHAIAEEKGIHSSSQGSGNTRYITVSKNRNKYTISNSSLRRLCKDYSLPIEIYESPYFEYFVNLYEPLLKIKEKLQMLEIAINAKGSEKAFWDCYNDVIHTVTQHVKSKECYAKLSQVKPYKPSNEHPSHVIVYSSDYADKFLISLDLSSANFNSLKHFDSTLVDEAKTWREFLGKFTDLEYLLQSKHFRQMVFGNLNGKALSCLEKNIMKRIWSVLVESGTVSKKDFVSLSNDEIIISSSKETIIEDTTKISHFLTNSNQLSDVFPFTKVEAFHLVQLSLEQSFYVKEIIEGKNSRGELETKNIAFKGIAPSFFSQCYKRYYHQTVNEIDRKFMYNNMIATFDSPLFTD